MRYLLLALLLFAATVGCKKKSHPDIGNKTEFGRVIAVFEGELTDDDEKRPEDGSRFDTIETTFKKDATITIRMTGDGNYDTFLMVGYPDETAAGINDDCNDTDRNVSCVEFVANQKGTYQILANAYDHKGRGAYTIHVYQK